MNLKRSTTSVVFAVMALSLISMTAIQQDAFAQTQGMSITAKADRNSDTITVTGKTVSKLTDVTFRVISPSGNNVVVIDQVSPMSDGTFETKFKIGPTWKENGFYTISAKQSLQQNSIYTLDVEVEVVNGMAKKTSATESSYSSDIFVPSGPNIAKDAGLEIHADAVIGSSTIEISGQTDRVSQDVTLTVTAPNGNKVSIGQITPMLNGEFSTTFNTGGPLWKQDGFYTVTAKQFDDPKYTASTEVEIEDGVVVPEFGTIAAMILAVAIISIIAVSARSRLSIIPRY
ncbi:PEFG-CTERM sorting domain-containing protein [Nitrosopumilus sp. b2]|uniref:PEFG-CTERM sorting domain-containing protein n=1 Tax=Nitrosopumilus sp. b2 TaxID=2109908 RepID=UPI0015F5BF42|nr:PEFG-CTERM sorting domain-containing protein [Nitrosopumilus sp. b2]KAF6245165.1 PEFG-CTERM domain-containing protein [Nitrosopumilus sp. b2]